MQRLQKKDRDVSCEPIFFHPSPILTFHIINDIMYYLRVISSNCKSWSFISHVWDLFQCNYIYSLKNGTILVKLLAYFLWIKEQAVLSLILYWYYSKICSWYVQIQGSNKNCGFLGSLFKVTCLWHMNKFIMTFNKIEKYNSQTYN